MRENLPLLPTNLKDAKLDANFLEWGVCAKVLFALEIHPDIS